VQAVSVVSSSLLQSYRPECIDPLTYTSISSSLSSLSSLSFFAILPSFHLFIFRVSSLFLQKPRL